MRSWRCPGAACGVSGKAAAQNQDVPSVVAPWKAFAVRAFSKNSGPKRAEPRCPARRARGPSRRKADGFADPASFAAFHALRPAAFREQKAMARRDRLSKATRTRRGSSRTTPSAKGSAWRETRATSSSFRFREKKSVLRNVFRGRVVIRDPPRQGLGFARRAAPPRSAEAHLQNAPGEPRPRERWSQARHRARWRRRRPRGRREARRRSRRARARASATATRDRRRERVLVLVLVFDRPTSRSGLCRRRDGGRGGPVLRESERRRWPRRRRRRVEVASSRGRALGGVGFADARLSSGHRSASAGPSWRLTVASRVRARRSARSSAAFGPGALRRRPPLESTTSLTFFRARDDAEPQHGRAGCRRRRTPRFVHARGDRRGRPGFARG